MAKFTSKNQPDKKKGRGQSERTKILESMKRIGRTEEDFYDLLATRAFNPEDNFGFVELMRRISPIPKQVAPMVSFEFDESATPLEQARQVVKAAADGVLPPDVAKMFTDSISAMLKIQEVTNIDERLKAMEDRVEQGQ